MQKINTSQFTKKRKIITLSLIVLAVVLAIAGYFLKTQYDAAKQTKVSGLNSINYGNPTGDQQQNGSTIKQKSATSKTGSGSDQPSAPTTNPGSTQSSVNVSITAANQSGTTLQVRALIGAVVNTGTCTITFMRTGQTTVTETSSVQPLASTSTCEGFNVPTSNLSPGIWHMTITYNDTALTGASEKDVTIQ